MYHEQFPVIPRTSEGFPADFIDRVASASAIFAGTVVGIAAKVRGGRDLAVIRVDALTSTPAELVPGSEIVRSIAGLEVGDQAYFFIAPGTHEAWHLPAGAVTLPVFHARVHEVVRYLADTDLHRRLRSASRVFVATWSSGALAPRLILRGDTNVADLEGSPRAAEDAIVVVRARAFDVLPLDQLERVQRLMLAAPVPPAL
jgi:hypothetical protein